MSSKQFPPKKGSEVARGNSTSGMTIVQKRLLATLCVICLGVIEKMLCATDPPWKQVAIAFNVKQSLLRLPVTPAEVYRGRAMAGYSLLGGAAAADVPRLIQLLNSQKSTEVQCCIAGVLGSMGPNAREAIPALMNAVTNQNAGVRRSAVFALRNIRRDNEAIR